jgi:hypothetical protein
MGQHAERIVENFQTGARLISIQFADFAKVEWFDCQAVTASV